jgi:thiamine biosynthesis lipoprotein
VLGGAIARAAVRAAYDSMGSRARTVARTWPMMGGHGSVILVGGTESTMDAVVQLADRCEALWSRFLPTSDITRLNWAEGQPVKVDALTVRLVRAMIFGAELSDGGYDPTLLPDLLAAGYTRSVVDPSLVTRLPASARAPGNIHGIRIEGHTICLPPGTTLDPGGIGKGLVADIVTKFGMAEGALGALAEIGGDVVVTGDAPEGEGWSIEVESGAARDVVPAVARLADGAVVTSSTTRRRWQTAHGMRHHLIDPATHESAASAVESVSVIAATGARAEVLSKSAFTVLPDDYLARLPHVGAAGRVALADGTTRATANWASYA